MIKKIGVTFLKFMIIPILLIVIIMNIDGGKNELGVVTYASGDSIYEDRNYQSTEKAEELDGLSLVLLPRHLQYEITINCQSDSFTVYRPISDKNDNQIFRWWESTKIDFFSTGKTANLVGVVKKTFYEKIVILAPGGPIISSPIFIDSDSPVEAYYHKNMKSYYFPYGYFGFFAREFIHNRFYVILGCIVFLSYSLIVLLIGLKKHRT